MKSKRTYTMLDNIKEWRKGCSVAGPAMIETDADYQLWREHPSMCSDCTEALIDSIENRLTRSWPRRLLARWL